MDRETADRIRSRAGGRCEYCGIPEADSGLRFHIEHITARQHGGDDEDGNLGLACPDCNWRKGTNLTGIDPDSSQVTRLFHPRQDLWGDHFHAEVPVYSVALQKGGPPLGYSI
jgi:5-methylcytosine-specific restriction endonuclease McrA